MLRYVTLRYVRLCYVTLCYVMLSYVTLRYVMLRYVTLCYVMLRYVTLCYVMLCYAYVFSLFPFLLCWFASSFRSYISPSFKPHACRPTLHLLCNSCSRNRCNGLEKKRREKTNRVLFKASMQIFVRRSNKIHSNCNQIGYVPKL